LLIQCEIHAPHLSKNINQLIFYILIIAGYDQIPVDSMQGLEIGGGSTYGAMDTMDVAHEADLSFDHLEELPAPPQENSVAAPWYDTDL